MQYEQKPLKEELAPLLSVIGQLGGKFTFMDEQGNQFVLASREVFEGEQIKAQEQQLALPQADTVARAIRKHIDSSLQDDVLDRINRDIALAYALKQELDEEVMDDLAAVSEDDNAAEDTTEFSSNRNIPVPPRIRFEPLKGDLSPELQ